MWIVLYTLGMNIITTPSNNTAVSISGGFARLCGKCGGTGIYWNRIMTASGPSSTQGVCFPCQGTGYVGKIFSNVQVFDKAIAVAEKARERREAKRQAEWEANRPVETVVETVVATPSVYLDANIGDIVAVAGQVVTAISVDTQFGTSRLIVVETENNEMVKMFTTASWAWDVSREDAIVVQGTVKSFEEYEGQAQTMISRPKKI